MAESSALRWQAEPPDLTNEHVIGGACVGEVPQALAFEWPVQQVHAPLLDVHGMGPCEHWLTDARAGETRSEILPGRHGVGLVRWREAGELLFGVMEMPVDLEASQDSAVVEEAAEAIYTRLFRLLAECAMPSPVHSLWRIWNYLPDIHGDELGLERYRRFNLGRARAFEKAGCLVDRRMPAACALGVRSGPVSVAFLAGRRVPLALENPRQVSAYRYPPAYGPQPPSFSRAATVDDGERRWLFVSGTASIVGHETVHHGDILRQLDETLTNIQALVDQANARHGHPARFAMESLHFRVYLRRRDDLPVVKAELLKRLPVAKWQICEADVCGADLLIEIEALGTLAWGMAQ